MISILSFDVEEWFHGIPCFSAQDRADSESTIEEEFELIATALAGSGSSATFFMLAEVTRSHPWMARRIVEAGWEVGSHGAGHRSVHEMDPSRFREGLKRSVRELEDQTGTKVRGFRAPMWSLGAGSEWAIEAILDEGIEYDSSIFPLGTGDPSEPFLLRCSAGDILEVPPMPTRLGGLMCPLAAGILLRILPWRLYRTLLHLKSKRSRYVHVYLHPWELSGRRRRLSGVGPAARSYFNFGRRGAGKKFHRFVREFGFASVAGRMESLRGSATATRELDEMARYDVLRPWRIRDGNGGSRTL